MKGVCPHCHQKIRHTAIGAKHDVILKLVAERLTYREIGARVGCSGTAIYKYLEKHGVLKLHKLPERPFVSREYYKQKLRESGMKGADFDQALSAYDSARGLQEQLTDDQSSGAINA